MATMEFGGGWQRKKRKKKKICRGEKAKRKKKSESCGRYCWTEVFKWWLMVEMVVVRPVMRVVGGWRGSDERDKELRVVSARGGKLGRGWFFTYFGPNFLHAQAMKSTLIYKRLKRVILSTRKKFQPLIQLGTIPTVGSK